MVFYFKKADYCADDTVWNEMSNRSGINPLVVNTYQRYMDYNLVDKTLDSCTKVGFESKPDWRFNLIRSGRLLQTKTLRSSVEKHKNITQNNQW